MSNPLYQKSAFKNLFLIVLITTILAASIFVYQKFIQKAVNAPTYQSKTEQTNPLTIKALKAGNYPGSDFVIEQTLSPGSNYQRYVASYLSEGLKIYGLLTVPNSQKPQNGYPAIIFNHGYIPPKEYRTTERYLAYTDAFSRNGYIVFKPDYRGNGSSEGNAEGAYGSNAYTIDVLNALSSLKKYKDTDPGKIGMWGHSMGGYITLRSLVVTKDIKAAVIWGGVVGTSQDLLENWHRRPDISPFPTPSGSRGFRSLTTIYGTPEQNPEFWSSISANSFLSDISAPIQLHHGESDHTVPIEFSKSLYESLKNVGKTVEIYTYEGNDHNISQSLSLALQRSVDFFNKYLKGGS